MKIEVGKFYKTRDGRKATIYAIVDTVICGYPIHGYIEGNQMPTIWTSKGEVTRKTSVQDEDILSEWVEPRSRLLAYRHRYHPYGVILTDKPVLNHLYLRVPHLDEPEDKS